jgi:spectinomycin phosphotransferase
VYRVRLDSSKSYALKVKSGAFYEFSCTVSRFLFDRGIAEVLAPLPAQDGRLWVRRGDWTLALYPFVDGQTGWSDMTDAHWAETGRIFRRIHGISPPGVAGIRRETYDPTGYGRAIETIDTRVSAVGDVESESERTLRLRWRESRPQTSVLLSAMHKMGEALRDHGLPLVVCHADLHPGNLLRDSLGRVFVIDWDDVMLAPRERDFIFTGEPGSPFFAGYGDVQLDWVAVTYFRYERVVTDLIEYANAVLFREDLSEETKADAVLRFKENLVGSSRRAAERAAANVPAHLTGA